MIFLSLNYRGIANPSKKLALKRLIDSQNPSIIYLQELMIEGDKIIQDLSKLLKGLDFKFVDAFRHFEWKVIS
jgi:hypothetical protein